MVFILILSTIVILSAIFTNKFLNALGIPALLFFLCLGMLFGSDGILKISFTDYNLTKDLSSIGLGFIIFYGGFCTKWKFAKSIIKRASLLSTMGVFLTAILTCIFCHFVLKIGFLESFLIGSVIGSTDAASVFSILKAKKLNLKDNTAPLLEIESGSNDPMSYILVILAITLMQGNSVEFVAILFFKQIIFGMLLGFLIAKLGIFTFQKTELIIDGNESLFIIALVLICYASCDFIQGNPFLAVYFLGIILGNADLKNKSSMMNFFDGITKLAQIGIFFALGLLATPSKAIETLKMGVLIFIFLTFIARPIIVWILLAPFKSSLGQKILTAWAGLRGVASIVFAIIAMDSGIILHYDLFHLVFIISIFSVAIQGTLLPIFAKQTKMIDTKFDIRETFNDYQEECAVRFLRVKVPNKHFWIGKKIKNITFPQNAKVLFIKRDGKKILPKESTEILKNDIVTLIIPSEYI